MRILTRKGKITEFKSAAVVVPWYEDAIELQGKMKLLDEKTGGIIGDILASGDFEGRMKQISILYTRGLIPARRIVLVGAGKKTDCTMDTLRSVYATAAKQMRTLKLKEFSTSLEFIESGESIEDTVQAVVEGVMLGLYQYANYKTVDKDKKRAPKEFVIVEEKEDVCKTIRSSMEGAERIARAVFFARDMVSAPGNDMTPTDMVREAGKIASRENVVLRVLDERKLKKIGMNAMLGVAKGSAEPARFIILEYGGGKKSDPPVVLVGKGLIFDSGGISIKPAEKMDEMKSDMAGGAAVMGAIMAAADLQLQVNIVGLIPATENLPGGRAYKPGDILKSLSGKTIEVISTDAEGRLILADALTYAERYKPAAIIDLATLTGACIIALGDISIGMLGTDEELKNRLKDAAEKTGERVWELPLWDEYHELIKSDIADYKNTGGRPGGAITAAAFLSKFIGKSPWVHLDIAGPSWFAKDRAYIPKGATGIGVRLLVQFLKDWQKKD